MSSRRWPVPIARWSADRRPCAAVAALKQAVAPAFLSAMVTESDHFALSAAAFLHSERNFLRSLPLSPLASASFEHSSEAAVRAGFSAFFSAGAIFGAGVAAGAGVAGAVVCANAELTSSRDPKAVAATPAEIGGIESTSGWRSGHGALRWRTGEEKSGRRRGFVKTYFRA